jgi:hypothetical protein
MSGPYDPTTSASGQGGGFASEPPGERDRTPLFSVDVEGGEGAHLLPFE